MKIREMEESPFAFIPHLTAGPGGGQRRSNLPLHRAWAEGFPPGVGALFATADLQGRDIAAERLLGEVVAEYLEALSVSGVIPPAEEIGVLLCGDLYAKPDPGKRGGLGEVGSVWCAFAERFRWVAGVLGNHDLLRREDLAPFGARVRILDEEVTDLDGLQIGGVSGIVGSPDRANRRNEDDFIDAVLGTLGAEPEILMLHPSPSILDPRTRQRLPMEEEDALATTLRMAEDLLVTCGHMYWEKPLVNLTESVQVLNVDSRGVILLPFPQ